MTTTNMLMVGDRVLITISPRFDDDPEPGTPGIIESFDVTHGDPVWCVRPDGYVGIVWATTDELEPDTSS